jgi:hypothetical protein
MGATLDNVKPLSRRYLGIPSHGPVSHLQVGSALLKGFTLFRVAPDDKRYLKILLCQIVIGKVYFKLEFVGRGPLLLRKKERR